MVSRVGLTGLRIRVRVSVHKSADLHISGHCFYWISRVKCRCVDVRMLWVVNMWMLSSVLWRCWLGGRKGIRPVKNWVVGCWHGCLGWVADLHMAQQMPLPLTISCSSKSRLALTFLVLPFWYLLTWVVPDIFQKSSKTVVFVSANLCNLQTWWVKHYVQTFRVSRIRVSIHSRISSIHILPLSRSTHT